MTQIAYFDGRDSGIKGVYNKPFDTVFVNAYLNEIEMKKVTYHELGHKNHTADEYERNCERCELQANRNMIHHLMKEELSDYDDIKEFNYAHFMEKYKLETITDEVMIQDEFHKLAGGL